jgi:predicted HicB family RNase H-like nuclease
VRVRVNPDLMKRISAAAKLQELTVSEWIRAIADVASQVG